MRATVYVCMCVCVYVCLCVCGRYLARKLILWIYIVVVSQRNHHLIVKLRKVHRGRCHVFAQFGWVLRALLTEMSEFHWAWPHSSAG